MMAAKFINGCNHKDNEFIGTIHVYEGVLIGWKYYDVYVYEDKYEGHNICLRYGNEPEEYLSPSTLIMALLSSREQYKVAAKLISERGYFKYVRR